MLTSLSILCWSKAIKGYEKDVTQHIVSLYISQTCLLVVVALSYPHNLIDLQYSSILKVGQVCYKNL